MAEPDTDEEVVRLAAGLTDAMCWQMPYLDLEVGKPARNGSNTCHAMEKRGLVTHEYRPMSNMRLYCLTPLGLAVRQHIARAQKPRP